MRVNEKSDFAKLMTAVAELYGKKMSSALLSIYWGALERFCFADIRRAITQHVNNADVGQFIPKPADIVRYLEGDSHTHALQAWSKVESAIRRIGAYDSVAFDDPIINIVIADMGGWGKMCAIATKEMPFRANEFMKRYQGYFRGCPMNYPKYLRGIFEHTNRVNDYPENTISVLVGDELRALSVLKEGNHSSSLTIHHESVLAIDFVKKQSDQSRITIKKNNERQNMSDEK